MATQSCNGIYLQCMYIDSTYFGRYDLNQVCFYSVYISCVKYLRTSTVGMCHREAHAHSLHKNTIPQTGNLPAGVRRQCQNSAGWSARRVTWVPDLTSMCDDVRLDGIYIRLLRTYVHTLPVIYTRTYACIPMIYTQIATCGKIAHTNVTSDRVN